MRRPASLALLKAGNNMAARYRNDGNDHQQFDQGERAKAAPGFFGAGQPAMACYFHNRSICLCVWLHDWTGTAPRTFKFLLMTKQKWILIVAALLLACIYVYHFTGWFKPKIIQISYTERSLASRPFRNNPPTVLFGFAGQPYRLSEIKVVPLASLANQSIRCSSLAFDCRFAIRTGGFISIWPKSSRHETRRARFPPRTVGNQRHLPSPGAGGFPQRPVRFPIGRPTTSRFRKSITVRSDDFPRRPGYAADSIFVPAKWQEAQ